MIQIVEMKQNHVAAIAAMEKEFFSMPWSAASIASELDNPLALWLVVLDGEKVVGYVGSQAVMGEADMMNIAVSSQYRRQGIAETMVSALIELLCSKGNHSLTLEVRKSNIPAKNLYAKMGFLEVGCRPNYYVKPTEDALILRKEWSL